MILNDLITRQIIFVFDEDKGDLILLSFELTLCLPLRSECVNYIYTYTKQGPVFIGMWQM